MFCLYMFCMKYIVTINLMNNKISFKKYAYSVALIHKFYKIISIGCIPLFF